MKNPSIYGYPPELGETVDKDWAERVAISRLARTGDKTTGLTPLRVVEGGLVGYWVATIIGFNPLVGSILGLVLAYDHHRRVS